jgi:uncharacterized protein YggT (Ycf19 family)
MGNAYFADSASFLVQSLFDLFILALILRLIFQLVLTRTDYNNPIWQAVVKLTGPVLHPLRRFVPGYKGIDVATIVLALLIKMLEIFLLRWLFSEAWSVRNPGSVRRRNSADRDLYLSGCRVRRRDPELGQFGIV